MVYAAWYAHTTHVSRHDGAVVSGTCFAKRRGVAGLVLFGWRMVHTVVLWRTWRRSCEQVIQRVIHLHAIDELVWRLGLPLRVEVVG